MHIYIYIYAYILFTLQNYDICPSNIHHVHIVRGNTFSVFYLSNLKLTIASKSMHRSRILVKANVSFSTYKHKMGTRRHFCYI